MKAICNYDAVSPVVGIMLMLVVTILIAAVVSAFAGGFGQNQAKTPQAIISGTYSQSSGMTVSHDGGDVLSAYDIQFYVSPTSSWGAGGEYKTYVINKSVIASNNTIWAPSAQYLAVKKFGPGDTITISKDDLQWVQSDLYSAGGVVRTNSTSSFAYPGNIGNTIVVKIFDMKTQKYIAQSAPIIITS